MSEAAGSAVVKTRNRPLLVLCLITAMLMQSLDATVANVALPYMQGSLSASYDQITWVLTSYVATSAIMTSPVGWLSAKFGRKTLFLAGLVGFTVASMLCGVAGSLPQIVVDRAMQGACGAFLVPLAQSTMLDIYEPEKRGAAMSVFGMGVMIGPIVGPTLGGYLTSEFNWRYVFFLNLPFGILAAIGLLFLMPKFKSHGTPSFDWTGFLVLSLGLATLQIALDRGEQLDWLSSSTIIACFVLAGVGFYLFVVHMMMARNTFIPREIFLDRNFAAGLLTMFSLAMVLLASSALLAPYLENLANYPVEQAGIVMAPRGAGTMIGMLVVGRLVNRFDPRWLMLLGYFILEGSLSMQEGWTPSVSPAYMAVTTMLQGAGLGTVFVPLQVIAFVTLAPELRTQGTSILSLVRNLGAAIGVSITSALLDHQNQYEHAVLSQFVTPFARALQGGGRSAAMLNPGSGGGASLLNSIISTQAQIISYVDDYHFMLISVLPAAASLLLMRRPPKLAAQPG